MASSPMSINKVEAIGYQGITTTENTSGLYSGKHFSDYKLILFVVEDINRVKRVSLVMASLSVSNAVVLLVMANTIYSVSINIKDNGTYSVKVNDSTPIGINIKIYGILF